MAALSRPVPVRFFHRIGNVVDVAGNGVVREVIYLALLQALRKSAPAVLGALAFGHRADLAVGRPLTGVRWSAQPGTGRKKKSWPKVIAP